VSTAALKAGARKAELLNVPVLSHLPLLLPVADALTQALQNIQLHSPRMVYVSNVKARVLRTAVEVASVWLTTSLTVCAGTTRRQFFKSWVATFSLKCRPGTC
jgi:acyl transferase domain-containing protein